MMKRIMSLLLALCMMLAAVGAVAEEANAEKTLTIWACSYGTMADFDNLPMTKWFEERTGVHINWIEVPNADRTTVFNTSIASEEYPDIYMTFYTDYLTAAEDKVIIPLEDLIDQYAPNLKAKLDANPAVREAITAPDGHIYSFPKVNETHSNKTPNIIWVYTEWLNAFEQATGKGEPQTAEEFEEMLLWLRDNDLNGNGDANDEIIITGNYNYGLEGGSPLLYPMGAYTYVPVGVNGPDFFYVNDEGVTATEVLSDDFREGLKFCAKLFSEGLIGSEAFTQTLVDMRAMTSVTYDSVNIACIPAPYDMRAITASDAEDMVKITDYTALAPLDNYKTGEKVTPMRRVALTSNRGVITSACENPELAMSWLDNFYADDVIDIMLYAGWEENGDWAWVDGVTSVGGDNRAVVIAPKEDGAPSTWAADWIGSTWLTAEKNLSLEATAATLQKENVAMMYLNNAKDAGWPYINWCSDVDLTTEYTELKQLMKDDIYNAMTEFAMGIRDINDDAAWESYKQDLLDDGLEEFLELCNQYYNLK